MSAAAYAIPLGLLGFLGILPAAYWFAVKTEDRL